MAAKVGVNDKTYGAYEVGRNDIPHDVQGRLRKVGFTGPWPREEAQAPSGDFTPREDYWKLVGRVETLERTVEKLGEIVRDLVRESEESRRAERP